MRSAPDDLYGRGLEGVDGGCARREEVGGCDEGRDAEGYRREEAEGVLDAHYGGVHLDCWFGVQPLE